MNEIKYNPHVSVDCVVFGFDGEKLKVLLIERNIREKDELYNDKKLPGSIILENENLDDAANRILNELTGLKNITKRKKAEISLSENEKRLKLILQLQKKN